MTKPAGPLLGDRIRLTAVQRGNIPDLVRLWTDDQVRRYLGGPLSPNDARERAELVVGARDVFFAERIEDGAALGLCTLGTHRTGDTEVSYEFLPEFWGRGYAREAVAMVVGWAFDHLNVASLIAVTQAANARSCRLLTALGMTEEDRFVEYGAAQSLYVVARAEIDRKVPIPDR